MEEVRIPGTAYGMTLVRIMVHLVAPNAKELSLYPLGIARNDSSLAAIITGNAINASVTQPASSEIFQPKNKTNAPKPKMPNTTEGTPARFRIERRMAFNIGPGLAYS